MNQRKGGRVEDRRETAGRRRPIGGTGLVLGLAVGLSLTVALENMAVGVAIGAGLALLLEAGFRRGTGPDEESGPGREKGSQP